MFQDLQKDGVVMFGKLHELSNSKNCIFKVIECDTGIGFLKILDDFEYKLQMKNLKICLLKIF